MHPLHKYLARQLTEKLRVRRIVVWYDPRREFDGFIAEARGGEGPVPGTSRVVLEGLVAALAEYDGSFLAVRLAVEPLVAVDAPGPVVVFVPGAERDRTGSLLMVLEAAGETYEPQLKRLARNVLRQKYTDGTIDQLLVSETVSWDELARAVSTEGPEPPSLLKVVFHGVSGSEAILASWLTSASRDADLVERGAVPELARLVKARLGLEVPADAEPGKLRAITARYVLGGEFRLDLRDTPPESLQSVPRPPSREFEEAVREMAQLLRDRHADAYAALADRVEQELGLAGAKVAAGTLGSIDTFRFEERALLSHCGELIVAGRYEEALAIVKERERSFWLERDLVRKAHWEACRRMAELGRAARDVRATLPSVSVRPEAWVEAYVKEEGAHRLDLLQRRLESLVTNLEEDADERALGVVRRAYEDAVHEMALGFTQTLRSAKFSVSGPLTQTQVWDDVVAPLPRPVAVLIVDALRYEMGAELASRLPSAAEIDLRPALCALPSITPVGMGALMPGASGSFAVVEEGGKLGAKVDGAFLPDLAARRRHAAGRVPQIVDLTLDDLLGLPPGKLKKKLDGATVILVRSQEIDQAGESGFAFQARRVMDGVIDNLVRAIRRLAAAGVGRTVVTADHGHLFFPVAREESMRSESPGGAQVELHRRCWIGRGGATPTGTFRVPASKLGYDSDLDFVFPEGAGVLKAGGDLAFHHGGTSLQEMVIPVLTVRMPGAEAAPEAASPVEVSAVPAAIVTRMMTVTVTSLLGGTFGVSWIGEGRRVGKLFGAMPSKGTATVDRETSTVTLGPDSSAVLGLLLTDDTVREVRLALLDPATDAEIYRSREAIPVKLGV